MWFSLYKGQKSASKSLTVLDFGAADVPALVYFSFAFF